MTTLEHLCAYVVDNFDDGKKKGKNMVKMRMKFGRNSVENVDKMWIKWWIKMWKNPRILVRIGQNYYRADRSYHVPPLIPHDC